jgi:predicted transcriptional regulator
MTTIMLEVADDIAADLTRFSQADGKSIQELSSAVLEQWLLDQASASSERWADEDVAAILEGVAQSRAGQTIPHSEACARLFAKAN